MMRCPTHLEIYRRRFHGMLGDLHNGLLIIPARSLTILFSNGEGWEHASVSRPDRTPTWDEMEWVKRELWEEQDTVMQLHVPPSEHINRHPYCLHLWRRVGADVPRPPSWMVG